MPGGSEAAATIHIARTVVRRAERSIVSLQKVKINEVVLKYVNRLSDYLFAIARVINARLQVKDVEYNRSALVFVIRKRRKWSNSLSFCTFSVIYQNREGMVVIRKRRMYMKVLKCGVMLLSMLFVSQLHVYAEKIDGHGLLKVR